MISGNYYFRAVMDVPTGILISFGDEEEGNVSIKPHEEPIAPPRRSKKGRSVRGSVNKSTTQQQQADSNVEQQPRESSKDKGAEVNLRGVTTAKKSPPGRPTSPPKRPQSMPVPVGTLVDFSSSSSEASEVMKSQQSEMVEEQNQEEIIGSPGDKLKQPVSILFRPRKKAKPNYQF